MKKKAVNKSVTVKGFFVRKDAGKGSGENIHEMIFYLKKNYSANYGEQAHVYDIPQDCCSISLEEMSNRLKTYSKSIIEVVNGTLKYKALFRG